MSLLINEHKSELDTVDQELQEMSTTLSSFNTVEGFATKDKQIIENLAKLSKQLITEKEKKLISDQKAFSGSKAYMWPNVQPSKPFRRPSNTNTNSIQNTEPVYSDSYASSSSFSSFSHRSFIQARKRTKRHNTSPTHWKQRNANEHLGDQSVSNLGGDG